MFSFGKLTREKLSDVRYQKSPVFTFFPITDCTLWLARLSFRTCLYLLKGSAQHRCSPSKNQDKLIVLV